MQSYFSADFFRGNRERLREDVTSGYPIVLFGNGLVERGGDSTFAFQQDSNFWYLTGCEVPDTVLVIDGQTDYLLVPPRDDMRQTFDGTVAEAELIERAGVAEVRPWRAGWQDLRERVRKRGGFATVLPGPSYSQRHGVYANPASYRLITQLRRDLPGLKIEDIRLNLERARMVKQGPELAALQTAIDITAEAIDAVRMPGTLAQLVHEYQLEAALTHGFRSKGARGHAFEPIVANGERACTLHNIANDGPLEAGLLTVVDVGAEVEHYAADITRTLATTKPTSRQQAVYTAVRDVQEFAMNQLKPGVLLREYELAVARYMGKKLQALGLITTIDGPSVRKYFPHATSHFLGLDVHDAGDYTRPLEPGMVLTVEPGIYIAEEALGVRLEDDVLVTKTGIDVLSDHLAHDLYSGTI